MSFTCVLLHLCCSAYTGKLSAKFIEVNIHLVNDLVICLYSIVFVDTYVNSVYNFFFLTLQELGCACSSSKVSTHCIDQEPST